ncbi:hypothetical protein [Clostridium sp. Cult2]|nr:hypothetical protein [Clostridium sp. Cult2]
MNFKRKLAIVLSVITVITLLSTVAFAKPIHVPPEPIRDSIILEF